LDRTSRRRFLRGSLALAGLGLLSGCGALPGEAQRPARVPRIGYLSVGPSEPSPLVDAFRRGLAEHGYVEGQSVAVEYRFGEERTERLSEYAAELVRLPVDLIVARGAPAQLAAKRATSTIPIVFPVSGNPVELGLVESLARPGGNLTGLTNISQRLSSKRLELLTEAVPRVARVAVLWHQDDGGAELASELPTAAQQLQLQLQSVELRGPVDLERAFEAAARERADAALTLGGTQIVAHQPRIAQLAAERRLPVMHYNREAVEAGGLIAYGPNLADLFRRAATYVDKILKGARPADLPVEGPTRFDFAINLKAAEAIGLTIPPSVLQQATEIIQ
jgi:putative tryptophan/tyrosine transport system substrate-binding protein